MIIQMCNQKGSTIFAAVRFGNVLGSNGSVIPLFIFKEKSYLYIFIPFPPMDKDYPPHSETRQLLPAARQSVMQHSKKQ